FTVVYIVGVFFFADKIFIMIRYVTLVLSLFIGIESSAQQQIKILNAFQHYKIQASTDYNKLLFIVRDDNKHTTFETAYLNEWEDAFLVVSENEIYSIKARYNIFEDAIYVKIDGQEKLVFPHLIQGVIFKNQIFVSRKEMIDSGLKDGYYELLSEGDREFLKKYLYTYKVDKKGNVKLKEKKERIYIKNSKGLVEPFDLSAKTFYSNFKGKQKVLKDYVKTNALRLKKTDDLVALFDYYNRILAKE
ncbi:MAG: hypothetical protein AAFO82_10315, partial [Bacteroidota bacterium]